MISFTVWGLFKKLFALHIMQLHAVLLFGILSGQYDSVVLVVD
jgi:hypothetical protein